VVMLGDTIIDSVIPVTQQLIDVYNQFRQTVIAVEEVAPEKTNRYGIIDGKAIDERTYQLSGMVEKPEPGQSPSNLAVAGRYILTPEIYKVLEMVAPGKQGEIQLTDALRLLLNRENIYAYRFEGKRHDIGNKLDYLKTTVEYALKREEFAQPFMSFLREVVAREDKNGK